MRAKFGVLEQTQGLLHLQAKFQLNVFIVSASGDQNPQYWANFDIFWSSSTDPLLPIRVKFGVLEQTQGLHLPAKFHLNVFIVSAPGGQKPQFLGKFWRFWVLLYRPPFTDEGQIWWVGADPRSTLTRQISYECVHCVGFRWPKTTILGKSWHFWGLLYRRPFTDEGQIWCAIADPWCTFTCQISSRSVYSVALCWRKTPIFATFWISAFSGVASWQHSEKVEHGCTSTNLPYPTVLKSFLYSNAFMAKSGAQSLTFKRVTNKHQTNQKTQGFWLPRRRVKSEPHQTWQGDRGPRARSCTWKTFGGLTHSFAVRGHWKFGGNKTPQLKTQ